MAESRTKSVTEAYCTRCHGEIMKRFKYSDGLTMLLLTFIALLMSVTAWAGFASKTAADEAAKASCRIGEHVASDEAEDKVISKLLEGMETRQIHMGERIDGIYQKLGE